MSSVVLVVVGRGEITAGPHGTAAVGLRLKTLWHVVAQCAEKKLGVTMATRDHVTAAVSCCLEMALWSTLWIAGQVSLMASRGCQRLA